LPLVALPVKIFLRSQSRIAALIVLAVGTAVIATAVTLAGHRVAARWIDRWIEWLVGRTR
jgi:hypothetical protein